LPQPAQPLTRPAAPIAAALPRADAGVRVMVKEVRFTHSDILSAADLEAIAADYRGKQVSLVELQQLADRVNALYKAKGVVTALATIPQQDVTEGVIEVRLVEGRVGAIHISGNSSTRDDYITPRLALSAGQLVDLNKLERSLIWFNQSNDIRLQADLQPGSAFATTDVNVTVVEPPRHELLLTLDNLGSPLTGAWRGGVSYRNRSLLESRDELYLSYTGAIGQDSGALSYAIPINAYGGRLSFGVYEDKTAIKNGDLSSLNITGTSNTKVLGVRQPVWIDSVQQWTLVGGGKQRISSNYIDGVFLQRTDDSDHNVGVEWNWAGEASSLSASVVQYWVDATIVDNNKYQVQRAWLRYAQALPWDLALRGNLNGQAAKDKNLPSGEQFVLGGEGSVRGYPVGSVAGDQGYTASLELHHPLPALSLGSQSFVPSGFLFADYGRVEPFRPVVTLLPPSVQLTGVGFGVNAALGKNLNGRLTFAWGLDRLPVPNQGQQRQVMFQLIASLI
jgi:hemolysin activation/secretion protein